MDKWVQSLVEMEECNFRKSWCCLVCTVIAKDTTYMCRDSGESLFCRLYWELRPLQIWTTIHLHFFTSSLAVLVFINRTAIYLLIQTEIWEQSKVPLSHSLILRRMLSFKSLSTLYYLSPLLLPYLRFPGLFPELLQQLHRYSRNST